MKVRYTIARDNVPKDQGAQGAVDIELEFKERPWWLNATCEWKMDRLAPRAETEIYDEYSELMALSVEFCDAISANINTGSDGHFRMFPTERI